MICRSDVNIITFKQDPESPAHNYVLGTGKLQMGDYYYNQANGDFTKIQQVLHEAQLKYSYPKVVATDNEKYKSIFKSII